MDILIASSLFSPFQLELIRELNRQPGIRARVVFTKPLSSIRGKHWQSYPWDDVREFVLVADREVVGREQALWLAAAIDSANPDVLIVGAFLKGVYHGSMKSQVSTRKPVGFWLEGVNPNYSLPKRIVASVLLRWRLCRAAFVLAIGDRAEQAFRRCNQRVGLVPYGQDLASCLNIRRAAPVQLPVRFCFSGQLLARHNIDVILRACRQLVQVRGASFRLTLAAHGPEQRIVDQHLKEDPALGTIIEYDRDFGTWEQRLRPLFNADILLYPSAHSGWGLVVPEAMAAGMPVITTREVEAARYYVRHEVDGLFVEPGVEALVRAMARFIDNPSSVRLMGDRARESARRGDVRVVAPLMVSTIRRFTPELGAAPTEST
jgi:glycosyltransferase involved in cell wall biosynthesis